MACRLALLLALTAGALRPPAPRRAGAARRIAEAEDVGSILEGLNLAPVDELVAGLGLTVAPPVAIPPPEGRDLSAPRPKPPA